MQLGFLGLGIMGTGMVRNLLQAGHEVTAWNRTARDLPDEIADHDGFSRAPAIGDAVAGAEVVLVCVTGPEAQDAIYGDIINALDTGTLVVDLTTTDPDLTALLAKAIEAGGGRYVDAPVFGSKTEAWNGELDIVIGGAAEDIDEAMPLLKALSKTTHVMGPTPAGAQMKLVGNLMVAAQILSVGEGLSLARKAGLDPDAVVDVLKVTDYSSGVVVGTASASLKGDYAPNFYLKHMLKDARLIGIFAKALGVPVPGAALVGESYQAAVNQGLGDLNASALHKMQFGLAGLDDD